MAIADTILEAMWYVSDKKKAYTSAFTSTLKVQLMALSKPRNDAYVDMDARAKELGAEMRKLRKEIEGQTNILHEAQTGKRDMIKKRAKAGAFAVAKKLPGLDPMSILSSVAKEFIKQSIDLAIHACAKKETLVGRLLDQGLAEYSVLLMSGEVMIEDAGELTKEEDIKYKKKVWAFGLVSKSTSLSHESKKLRVQMNAFESQLEKILSGSSPNAEYVGLLGADGLAEGLGGME